MFSDSAVRTGYIMLGIVKASYLRNALFAISRQFERVRPDDFSESPPRIVAGSPEDSLPPMDGITAALRNPWARRAAQWRRRNPQSRKR